MEASTWIVAGSSPTAPAFLPALYERERAAGVVGIACNGAYRLFPESRPDVYFIADQYACAEYSDISLWMKTRGIHLVTLDRAEAVRKERRIEHFDEFIPTGTDFDGAYTRGKYPAYQFSGLFCLVYALHHGAQTVHMVGLEGYRSNERGIVVDYFWGRGGRYSGARHTSQVIAPFTRNVIAAWPEVQFKFHGTPAFELSAPNLQTFSPGSLPEEIPVCAYD